MKRDNRGLSLVELITVIAILSVFIGMGILSVSLLIGTQAKGCAENVSSMLNETKTGCLSRFDETMTLGYYANGAEDAVKSDGYYTENKVYSINKDAASIEISGSEFRKMGNKNVVIKVYLSSNPSHGIELGTANKFSISFDRSTGAFEPVIWNGTQLTDYIEKITFSSGTRTYTISMVKETGKHTLSN